MILLIPTINSTTENIELQQQNIINQFKYIMRLVWVFISGYVGRLKGTALHNTLHHRRCSVPLCPQAFPYDYKFLNSSEKSFSYKRLLKYSCLICVHVKVSKRLHIKI